MKHPLLLQKKVVRYTHAAFMDSHSALYSKAFRKSLVILNFLFIKDFNHEHDVMWGKGSFSYFKKSFVEIKKNLMSWSNFPFFLPGRQKKKWKGKNMYLLCWTKTGYESLHHRMESKQLDSRPTQQYWLIRG